MKGGKMKKTHREQNPQVNCKSYNCYYNKNGKCKREGIKADKESCYCYIKAEE